MYKTSLRHRLQVRERHTDLSAMTFKLTDILLMMDAENIVFGQYLVTANMRRLRLGIRLNYNLPESISYFNFKLTVKATGEVINMRIDYLETLSHINDRLSVIKKHLARVKS